jgi:hypothetical protein
MKLSPLVNYQEHTSPWAKLLITAVKFGAPSRATPGHLAKLDRGQ